MQSLPGNNIRRRRIARRVAATVAVIAAAAAAYYQATIRAFAITESAVIWSRALIRPALLASSTPATQGGYRLVAIGCDQDSYGIRMEDMDVTVHVPFTAASVGGGPLQMPVDLVAMARTCDY